MNAVIQTAHAILMVTKRLPSKKLTWAELAGSATEALEKWKLARHPYVFADFGDLGGGMTGSRLASAMRKESLDVVVILLADEVQPHHRIWAQRNGATDVIERSAKAISAYLPSGMKPSQIAELTAGSPGIAAPVPKAERPEAIAEIVSDHLQQYGRLGPARTLVVRDAMEALMAEKGEVPTITELANRVAKEIMWPEQRSAFLNSFTTKGS